MATAGTALTDSIQVSANAEDSWLFLTHYLPYSLAVRELMRLRALTQVGELQRPILDVGCGDGLFWESIIRSGQQNLDPKALSGLLGLDISVDELKLASVRLSERGGQVLSADICSTTPLGQNENVQFRTVIANCSLEHVRSIESALRNIHSMLSDGGHFFLFVPVPRWTETLWLKRFLDRLSWRLGGLFGGAMDGFFQHNHLYPSEVWRFLLGGIGFDVVDIVGVGSRSANSVFERYLPTAFLSFVFKLFFKRYPSRRLSPKHPPRVERFLRDLEVGEILSRDLAKPDLVEYFIICRKRPTISSTTG